MATKKRPAKKAQAKKASVKKQPLEGFGFCISGNTFTTPQSPPAAKHESPLIQVHVPEGFEQKLKAICDLCSAINSAAKALASASYGVTIRDCNVVSPEHGPGITIG